MTRPLARLGLLLLLEVGCASVQRVPLKSGRVVLPNGRFVGPIEIPVPRRADHQGHDFDIRVTLRSRCAPRLTLAFPDGETRMLGEDDSGWQSLLARRAKEQPPPLAVVEPVPMAPGVEPQPQLPPAASATSPAPPVPIAPAPAGPAPNATARAEPGPIRNAPVAPAPIAPAPPGPPGAIAAIDAELVIRSPPSPSGHWEATRTDSWPGQLAFERARAALCAGSAEYRLRYLNAYDESGTLALWAEVPQELLEAELEYEIVELVPAKPPPAAVEAPPPAPAAELTLAPAAVIPPRPRPPRPAPKLERPDPPIERTATWQAGHWWWSEGEGQWVWVEGHWAQGKIPALLAEATGTPPNPDCRWVSGYWTWERRGGKWVWQAGHWSAPPPREELRPASPGEGAEWIAGYWTWSQVRYVWIAGRWGRPSPRVETPPSPPFAGARWIPGDWIQVNGSYVWSAGFYQGDARPPPPRAETPPPSPAPGSIWLQGYWRWAATRRSHEWVAGHWELPPGEGCVWVPDPAGPDGIVIRGHWELGLRPAR